MVTFSHCLSTCLFVYFQNAPQVCMELTARPYVDVLTTPTFVTLVMVLVCAHQDTHHDTVTNVRCPLSNIITICHWMVQIVGCDFEVRFYSNWFYVPCWTPGLNHLFLFTACLPGTYGEKCAFACECEADEMCDHEQGCTSKIIVLIFIEEWFYAWHNVIRSSKHLYGCLLVSKSSLPNFES